MIDYKRKYNNAKDDDEDKYILPYSQREDGRCESLMRAVIEGASELWLERVYL